MVGTTSKGFPYPTSTDPVAAGAAAIEALARSVDTNVGRLAAGLATIAMVAPYGTVTMVHVNFPAGRFTAPPVIVTNPAGANPANAQSSVLTGSITTAGFDVYGSRSAGGATTALVVNWQAVQV